MPIEELPIFCYYDKQRFQQFGAQDCANWYPVTSETAKKQKALYPAMGRAHIRFLGQNRLIFNQQPRTHFKTIDFYYVIVGTVIYQYDAYYNQRTVGYVSLSGVIWQDFLVVGTLVYVMITDGTHIYLFTEDLSTIPFGIVTDNNAPKNPVYVAAFANRFVVSSLNSNIFTLSTINLTGGLAGCFTINGGPLFNSASGVIGQFGVLHGQLYIFTDYTTDIWTNISTTITVAGVSFTFPWKLNTSYNWDYGIADPLSLSIDFGRMVWLAKNRGGIVTYMVTNGQAPQDLDTQAINVLLEQTASNDELSPFLSGNSDGFLYQYENTIFYRALAGSYLNFGTLDVEESANAIEYNFDTNTWARVIELNGERNRIQKHVYFNNIHYVIVEFDNAIYQMAGNIYYNELLNPNRASNQSFDAFEAFPMRYELVTKQIFAPDYSEFFDDYVEIDFVFGYKTPVRSDAPFFNTQFIIGEQPDSNGNPVYIVGEQPDSDGQPVFVVAENSNTPTFYDNTYNILFKPHIELYYSDDGSVSFLSADNLEFSQLGQYRWRMRWYQLGASRNRCYKLIAVSASPIVVLGGVRNTRRSSGGAN
jgi:hypothetical protein